MLWLANIPDMKKNLRYFSVALSHVYKKYAFF